MPALQVRLVNSFCNTWGLPEIQLRNPGVTPEVDWGLIARLAAEDW